jgi:hypothetical protein
MADSYFKRVHYGREPGPRRRGNPAKGLPVERRVMTLLAEGKGATEVARLCGMKRETVYAIKKRCS